VSRNFITGLVIAGSLFAAGCTSTPPANPPATTAPPASSGTPATSPTAGASGAPTAGATGAPTTSATGAPTGAPAVSAEEATLYKSNGEVPPTPQLNAMIEDSLMRWNTAMQNRDFKPFVAWQARASQQYMKPDEDAKMTQPFIDNKIDFSQFKGVEPKVLQPPTVQDSQFGKVLSTTVEYAKGTDTLQVAAKYIDEGGLWRVGEFKVEFDRKGAGDGPTPEGGSPEAGGSPAGAESPAADKGESEEE
jgi:hypothetical protein